jgi:hypothetical protein
MHSQYFPPNNDCKGKRKQGYIVTVLLLKANQQLPESVYPRVRDFYNPTMRLETRGLLN